jgi:signal transduction histidine kinase
MPKKKKTNCWEYLNCGYGPGSTNPCPATTDATCHGLNGGTNAGRLCWTIKEASCKVADPAWLAPLGNCISCRFFLKVRKEEGEEFYLLKLGQSVGDTKKLHYYISQIESLMHIRKHLFTDFSLKKNVKEIAVETKKVTGAKFCGVYFIRGEPPKLFLETSPHRGQTQVVLPLDDTTAVGFVASCNQIINLKVSKGGGLGDSNVPFSMQIDQRSGVQTESFAAVPFRNNDGKVMGVLTAANSKKGFFSQDDLWFMVRYCFELSIALEKATLLEESISAVRLASIGETVAGLAHCIKGIAHALKVSSYVVRKEIVKYSIEDLCTAWEILEKNIARLADLSVDVLSHKSGHAGVMVRTDLNQCAKDAVRLLEAEAAARAIKFSASFGKGLSNCLINPSRIYRCLVNLIINAFDACTPQGGSVIVKTEKVSSDEALISVVDTGRGMDDKSKAIVFDLFKTTKKKKGGGIGLPTVYDIVKQHRGRIEIDSRKGQGTTFRIFIKVD